MRWRSHLTHRSYARGVPAGEILVKVLGFLEPVVGETAKRECTTASAGIWHPEQLSQGIKREALTTHEPRAGAGNGPHVARMAVTLAVFHLEMSSLMLSSPRNLQEALH